MHSVNNGTGAHIFVFVLFILLLLEHPCLFSREYSNSITAWPILFSISAGTNHTNVLSSSVAKIVND